MSLYDQLHSQLGYLTFPLLLCSLVTLALLLEKLVVLTAESLRTRKVNNDAPVLGGSSKPLLVARGINLLCHHGEEQRSLREEIAAIWLSAQRNKLSSGIRLLQVMALVTPLLGLLGTVLGLIQVFENLSDHRGPIEPSLLADGLGLAMHTTAVGLIIALPALAGAHGFQIWIDRIIYRVEHGMNQMNLFMDGVDMRKKND